jgi:hypothetical protein
MPLPRVLSARPTASLSMLRLGTGRAVMTAHVLGSRRVPSENT